MSTTARLWRIARVVAVVATVALVVALVVLPQVALGVLWDIVIPLVPASLLISPALWRNVCPLAALNMALNRLGPRRVPTRRFVTRATTVGIVLLAVLVPARRFSLNTDGGALAVTIVAVALAALALGAVYDAKAGFCNALCPVLPVERLYGQAPLAVIGNPHCVPCTLCARGCLDVAPAKSLAVALGPARKTSSWLTTPYGVFAAAFPGFVVGYFTASNGPLRSAGAVYLGAAAWALASFLTTAAVTQAARLTSAGALRGLAAAAAGLYYWFASDVMATRLGIAGGGTAALRVALLTLVAAWLWSAVRHSATAFGAPRSQARPVRL
jgi:hypothetical protein